MSQTAIHEAKKLLRREIKKCITAMSSDMKSKESRVITEQLLSMEQYKSSKRISVYLSMPTEVNTEGILMDIFKTNRKCYIPRYVGANMDMLRLNSMEDMKSLPLTPWNIHQPADDDPREEALSTGGLDLIIIPGLGFSKGGQRLGRGKGYYDNYIIKCIELCHKKPHLIGLAFSTQMEESIPVTENDMDLDHVNYSLFIPRWLGVALFVFTIEASTVAWVLPPDRTTRDVTIYRRQAEGPQVYSGPMPCMDKNGSPQFPPPNGGPWPTDDKCHISLCLGNMVLTKSMGCMLKGAACPPGTYLEIPPKPQSPADCCVCKPYQPLRKRGKISVSSIPATYDPVRRQRILKIVNHAEQSGHDSEILATLRKIALLV